MGEPPRRFQIATRDPEAAHDWLRRAYTDHDVALSGPTSAFRFHHHVIDGGPFKLGLCRHSMTLRGRWAPLGDQLLVSHLVEGRFDISCRRSAVAAGPGDTFVYDPDVAMDVEWSDIVMSQIRIDRAAVERVLAELGDGEQSVGIGFDLARPLSAARSRRWSRTIKYVAGEVRSRDAPHGNPLLMREMLRLIVVTALDTFPSTVTDADRMRRPPGHVSAGAVRRAMAFMEEHAADDVDLVTIAGAAGVGPRALQRAFRRTVDRTPLDHLRSIRLDRAHVALREADPATGVTVAAIAARWGFAHPGRFAAAYRARFGRSPSETLRA